MRGAGVLDVLGLVGDHQAPARRAASVARVAPQVPYVVSTKPRRSHGRSRSRPLAPWKRRTATPGANRRISASQLPSSEAGQTTSVGPGRRVARCRCSAIRVTSCPGPCRRPGRRRARATVSRPARSGPGAGSRAAWRVQPGGRGAGLARAREQPLAQFGSQAPTTTAHLLAVDLDGAGQRGGQSVEAGSSGLRSRLRALRARAGSTTTHWSRSRTTGRCASASAVHLGLGQRVAAQRELPVEAGQVIAAEEGRHVGRGTVALADDGAGAQAAYQLPWPVHLDPGRAQAFRGPAEQILHVLVGQGQHVGDGAVEQPFQRRPRRGRPA